jgi:hypothetical protein
MQSAEPRTIQLVPGCTKSEDIGNFLASKAQDEIVSMIDMKSCGVCNGYCDRADSSEKTRLQLTSKRQR